MIKQSTSTPHRKHSEISDIPSQKEGVLSRWRAKINSSSVPRPIAIALVIVLLAGAGWVAVATRPAPVQAQTSDGFQADNTDIVWLRGKARETGGDIKRLSTEERAKADEAARRITGMGADALFSSPNALAPVDPSKFQESRTAAWRAAQGR